MVPKSNRPHHFTRRQVLGGGSALTAFAAMGGLSALVAACGGGDPIDEGAEPGTDFTGALGVLIGTHMDPVKALLEQHQASVGFAPTVEEVTTPDLRSKLTTSFLAQSSPWDAVFVTAELGVELGNRGWLTNASIFMDEAVRTESDLLTRGLGAVELDGNTLAAPWTMGSQLLHWNKRMMEQAGLDPDAPSNWHATPNSWDTFVEYAKAMTGERDGTQYYGYTDAWAGTHVLWTWGGMLNMHGGSFLDEEQQPSWNSEEGVEALQKLYDLLHTHQVVDPAVTTYTWVFDATPGFFEGTRGMFISWPFVAGVAAIPDASQIAGHSAFAPNPAVVTSGSVDGSEFFGVPVYAENKDEAWRLIEFITSREGQRVVAMGGWGSIYSGVLQEPDIVEAFPFYPALAKAYEYPVDGGWSEDRPRWTQMLADEIHEVLAGNKSPKQALDDAAAAATEARRQDEE